MVFYVRKRPKWVTFVNNLEELKSLIEYYIPGQPLLLGDVSRFNGHMTNLLLKFIEANPEIDCYSSQDITDKVLLSRFIRVEKEPLLFTYEEGVDKFEASDKDFTSIETHMESQDPAIKLRLRKANRKLVSLLTSI